MPDNPAQRTVERRLTRLTGLDARYQKVSGIFSLLRFFVVTIFLFVLFSQISNEATWLTNGLLLSLIGIFIYLVIRHARIKRKISDLAILRGHAETDLSRINLKWENIPQKGTPYDVDNPVAHDLKIVGPHSLIHLIDTSSSLEARKFLLELLLNPVLDIDAIEHRQKLIQSLASKNLLFAKCRLASGYAGAESLSGDAIVNLLKNSRYPSWGKALLYCSALLAVLNIFLLVVFGIKYFLLPFIVYAVLFMLFSVYSGTAYSTMSGATVHLGRVQEIFKILEERVEPNDPILTEHFAPLRGSDSPGQSIGVLSRYMNALSVRAFAPAHLGINALVPWDQFYTYKLESIREKLLDDLQVWLDTTAKTEAYFALGNFARLNPYNGLPEFINQDSSDQQQHEVEGLGHPLIPLGTRVVNDFQLDADRRIAVVTGSNMAGKSAFLRTIGINLCLAQAGAVVCATKYQSSLFQLVSCIDVTDDLDSGKSLFYVEIERLKQVLNTCSQGSHSTLFLIDEILKGTNNRERIIGGKKYLQSLSDKGAYGLVSTHDLEFANLADEVLSMFNIHFQESVIDDKMMFDHKLKPGRSQSTNALRIMEIENII